jgi:hypothetical protein
LSYRCTHYPIGSAKRNAKYAVRRMTPGFTSRFTKASGTAIAAAMTFGAMIWAAPAQAAECPRKGALGTSRVLHVDAATSPRVGLKSFPQSLPLQDREVVLTFDDGPWPGTTPKVLAALARECVLATFFLIGKPASEHPELVRRIASLGHAVGHHTWSHPGDAWMQLRKTRNKGGISGIKAAFMAPPVMIANTAFSSEPNTGPDGPKFDWE